MLASHHEAAQVLLDENSHPLRLNQTWLVQNLATLEACYHIIFPDRSAIHRTRVPHLLPVLDIACFKLERPRWWIPSHPKPNGCQPQLMVAHNELDMILWTQWWTAHCMTNSACRLSNMTVAWEFNYSDVHGGCQWSAPCNCPSVTCSDSGSGFVTHAPS